jgi:hypothetical protein
MTPPAGSPERKLGSLDVDAYLADPSRKQAFVTPMFDIIAPRYDAFTRLFSLGMDAGWKRRAIAAAIAVAPGARHVLDLASGTGDVAAQLARALAGASHCAAQIRGVEQFLDVAEAIIPRCKIPSDKRPAAIHAADVAIDTDARVGRTAAALERATHIEAPALVAALALATRATPLGEAVFGTTILLVRGITVGALRLATATLALPTKAPPRKPRRTP